MKFINGKPLGGANDRTAATGITGGILASIRLAPSGQSVFGGGKMQGYKLLKISEVAEILAVSKAHVYNLVEGGGIPSVRIGGAIRVPREALEQWIRANINGIETVGAR